MKPVLLAAAAVLALSSAAHAQRESKITGEALVRLCTAQNPKDIEACTAYVNGVADAAGVYQRLRPADGSKGAALPAYVCIPGPTTGVQLRQAVITFFRSHTGEGQRIASGMTLSAFAEAYPCQK